MFLDVATVNDVFARVAGFGDQTVMLWQGADSDWRPITANDLYGRVRALADVLLSWGVGKGDRVALLAENRWEWAVTDFATLAIGAVDAPLYPTQTADQVAYMLRDCGAKVAVASTRQQYEKIVAAGELPALEHVVVMDEGEFEGAESFSALLAQAGEKQSRDAAFDERLRSVKPEDLATIIYTSGTTGEPKGVMLTHGNLGSNVSLSTEPFDFSHKDSTISFLPLSHVTARHADYALLGRGVRLAYCPRVDRLPKAMQQVQPTIFVAVPRVYEKIRQTVESRSAASPMKARIFRWALATGKRHRNEILEGKTPSSLLWKLADKLVFSKIAEAFGGQVKVFIAGGAPLGVDTATWFADAGIRILEGYGLTETSPVIGLNYPEAYRMGTIGKPLRNVQCRIAEDGELEVKGPSIFLGYWNKPKETEEAFTPDGWFKTGDIGKIDADGFLSITDRKKELIKTSGGKFIAPQPIENRLRANALVAQAALVGDKHKFISVILAPNFPALEEWAKGRGIETGDHGALVKDKQVVKAYDEIVRKVNRELADFERIKRIALVPEEWTIEEGILTPSMKMKRRVVNERYADRIRELYGDEASMR